MPKYSTFQKAIGMHVTAHTKSFLSSKYMSHIFSDKQDNCHCQSQANFFFWSGIGLFIYLTELENILLSIEFFYNVFVLVMLNR